MFWVQWQVRSTPLEPTALVADGPVAGVLARRLSQADDSVLARLAGVAGDTFLALVGPTEHLPWVDGVRYFGVDLQAPALLLPTRLTAGAPLGLLERALLRKGNGAPLLVDVERGRLISLQAAAPIHRQALARGWGEGGRR